MTRLSAEFIAQAVKAIRQARGNHPLSPQEIRNFANFFLNIGNKIEEELKKLDKGSEYAKEGKKGDITLKKSTYAANLYGQLISTMNKIPKETHALVKIPHVKNLTKAYFNNSAGLGDTWNTESLAAALEKGLQVAPAMSFKKAIASHIQQLPRSVVAPVIGATIETGVLDVINGDSSKTLAATLTGPLLQKCTENYPRAKKIAPFINICVDQAVRHYLPDLPKVPYAPFVSAALSVGIPLLWSYRERIGTELKHVAEAFSEASEDYCDALYPKPD